jgi:hypothetical protein
MTPSGAAVQQSSGIASSNACRPPTSSQSRAAGAGLPARSFGGRLRRASGVEEEAGALEFTAKAVQLALRPAASYAGVVRAGACSSLPSGTRSTALAMLAALVRTDLRRLDGERWLAGSNRWS